MELIVLANDTQWEELLSNITDRSEPHIVRIEAVEEFFKYKNADGFIDLSFDGRRERIEILKKISSIPVIINSVALTLEEINAPFARINGWPGFLKRSIVEASHKDEKIQHQVENIFSSLNRKMRLVPDKPGFITARVVAMIINEAWFALQENVSTKEEIDEAMKLGTNYPYGPFEWCNKIGPKNIYGLLNKLVKTDPRYEPAALLKKEALM